MLEIEYIANVVGQILSVIISVWVILRSHRLAGYIMLFSFLTIFSASYIQIFMSDVIEFIPIEEGVIFDVKIEAPFWYEAIMVLRTIASILLPIGLWLAVKNGQYKNI